MSSYPIDSCLSSVLIISLIFIRLFVYQNFSTRLQDNYSNVFFDDDDDDNDDAVDDDDDDNDAVGDDVMLRRR